MTDFWNRKTVLALCILALLPLIELLLPQSFQVSDKLQSIFIFAFLGLGLHILTGCTGLLNLGVAAFMSAGAYSYAILTCDIYPFQVGFWGGLLGAIVCGTFIGVLLGLPTLRLSGDYLAIVTLGFGEIMQDVLRNVEVITKGTQGINPLPQPNIFGYQLGGESHYGWYYLLLFLLSITVYLISNVESSRFGQTMLALRDDELSSRCMGIRPLRTKLIAFSFCAAICALSGGLWASFLGSSGEPGNYDFQISILAVCMVIVGGVGSLKGVLLGALIMVGFNSVLLVKLSQFLQNLGFSSTESVFLSPNNWKYLVFGLALVLITRFRPNGILQRGGK